MKVRELRPADVPALRAIAEASGFPYPEANDPLVEAVLVVVDDQDRPLMAAGAKRLIELYLWCGGSGMTPHEKLAAIRLLHDGMEAELRTKGYNEAETSLPKDVSEKFGKRLEKTFGWVKNPWPGWCRRF